MPFNRNEANSSEMGRVDSEGWGGTTQKPKPGRLEMGVKRGALGVRGGYALILAIAAGLMVFVHAKDGRDRDAALSAYRSQGQREAEDD